MSNPDTFNELTAVSLRLVQGVLKNAHYNLSPGARQDMPTAKDEIEQAIAKLGRIANVLDPKVSNTVVLPEANPDCNCTELNMQYLCCKKEQYEAQYTD